MLSLEEALARLLSAISPGTSEPVPVLAAAGRVLAAPVVSPLDLPAFDNSAMDGYAVRAADVAGASASCPVRLKIRERLAAGRAPRRALLPQTCTRLFTGAPLPPDADAVVMQEDTRAIPEDARHVLVLDRVRPGENVRRRGEDVKSGAVVLPAGVRLGAGHLNLAAAVGCANLSVARQPVVGILATGSELRLAGRPLLPGQIYESNRAMLGALLASAGARPRMFPLVPDSAAKTRAALVRAFATSDLVVTCGGASVGELDFVKSAFTDLGGALDFWKVAIKPGKPFVFGSWQGKPLFGLPGNPVSAFVTFLLLVRPALLHWQGAADLSLPAHGGTLAGPLANRGDRRHFMRVRVTSGGTVEAAGTQASHMLHSLAGANGLVDVPPDTVLPAGCVVRVLRWE